MLDEAEYASDTDESDEDYNPGGDGSDAASEIESDGEPENDVENGTKAKSSKKRSAPVETTSVMTKRSKQTEVESKNIEKDVLDDDEDDNEDEIWAKFMNNTGTTATKMETKKPSTAPIKKHPLSNGSSTEKQKEKSKSLGAEQKPAVEQTKVVTEIFEFAGEKVEVKKEVKINDEKSAISSEINTDAKPTKPGPHLPINRARSGGGGGGLSSVLGKIGKKSTLSVLEKSKIDWSGFKQNEGIEEELQTHNKGRDGYLERQDFLQRTDLRQFELEKTLRNTNRKKL